MLSEFLLCLAISLDMIFLMKKFLYITILISCFMLPSQADDIRDFQIEGISIGDSALDYYSKNELNNGIKSYYPNKKFYLMDFKTKGSSYDGIQLAFKQNDKTFKIYSISGAIFFINKPFNDCLKRQKEITKEITSKFDNIKVKDGPIYDHPGDKTGKSKVTSYFFELKKTKDLIIVACYDWSKKMEYWDNLRISVRTKKYDNYISK